MIGGVCHWGWTSGWISRWIFWGWIFWPPRASMSAKNCLLPAHFSKIHIRWPPHAATLFSLAGSLGFKKIHGEGGNIHAGGLKNPPGGGKKSTGGGFFSSAPRPDKKFTSFLVLLMLVCSCFVKFGLVRGFSGRPLEHFGVSWPDSSSSCARRRTFHLVCTPDWDFDAASLLPSVSSLDFFMGFWQNPSGSGE